MSARGEAPAGALVWVNGARIAEGAPSIFAADRGFTLADGVFETIRVYAGVAFRLDAHLARLARGAAMLDIAIPAALGALIDAALRDAAAAGLGDAALRITLSRGAGGAPGLAPPPDAVPTLVLAVHPPPRVPNDRRERGLSAHVVAGRRNERSSLAACKTLAFTESVVALAEARAHGADDAILLDTQGHVSEGSASNVFVVSDEMLVTPPLSCGALPGVTRAAVIELARAAGTGVEERPLELDELLLARESFLTSSLREIVPLVRVSGATIRDGAPGPVTRRLIDEFASLVRRECASPTGTTAR